MITEAVLGFAAQCVTILVGAFPVWGPQSDPFSTSGESVGTWARGLNGYAPVSTIFVCLVLLIGLKVALFVWRGAVFVYHQFWGSN